MSVDEFFFLKVHNLIINNNVLNLIIYETWKLKLVESETVIFKIVQSVSNILSTAAAALLKIVTSIVCFN